MAIAGNYDLNRVSLESNGMATLNATYMHLYPPASTVTTRESIRLDVMLRNSNSRAGEATIADHL